MAAQQQQFATSGGMAYARQAAGGPMPQRKKRRFADKMVAPEVGMNISGEK